MLARLHLPRLLLASSVAFVGLVALPPSAALADATLASPTSLPTSFPYQPELPEVEDNPTDASINRGTIPYDEIAPKVNDWMDESDIISAQVIGQSSQGRDLHMVTITAPETTAETAQQEAWKNKIKYNAAAAKTDEALQDGYKQPIWFNNNIHGNEWEGTDSSMEYIEYLLENENKPEVKELLKNHRLYFTLTNNPDGRVAGTRATALGFDPNRDFVTNTLPETSVIRDLTSSIQPLFFVDIHGYTNVLQVEPTGPPHGENYDYDLFIPHAYAAALKIEKDVVDAEIPGNTYYNTTTGAISTTKTPANSNIKIPYRDTPSGWDDWPPVFTAQYVAYQGAIAYTAELPLGRANPATDPINKTRAAINIKVSNLVIDSTIDYIVDNGDELLENQIEIFRRGEAGEPLRILDTQEARDAAPGPKQWAPLWDEADYTGTTFPRGYVIPVGSKQKSATDTTYLVNYLRSHGLTVKKAKSSFTAGGKEYAKGSYIVDMHQPLRGLANALLAAGSDISNRVTSMYDISAWSHGYLWGATVDRIGSTGDPAFDVETETVGAVTDTGSVPSKVGSYLSFDLTGVDSFRALNALLTAGVKVSSIGDGTATLGNDQASHDAAASVAATYGVAFTATDGSELSGSAVKPLKKLTVGWNGSSSDDLTSLRQMGFANDQLVNVSAASIANGTVDLSQIDVLFVGGTLTMSAGAGTAAMQAYIDSGKGFVGRGTAASAFANTWLNAGATAVSSLSSGNGVVKLDTAENGPLGALGSEYGFVYPAVSFALSGTGTGKVEQTYAANPTQAYPNQGTLISGHWRRTSATNGPDYVVGRASVVSATHATSGAKGLAFGTSVTFRTHPRGHFSEILSGLYWTAKPAADGLVAPTATTTELSVPSTTFGEAAVATVKVTAASAVETRAGTVQILDGSDVVAEGAVNKFGNATITLPATLAAGSYDLVAEYTPAPGSALGTSVSSAATFDVAAAASSTTLSLSKASQTFGTSAPSVASVTVAVPEGLPAATGTVDVLVDGEAAASGPLVDGKADVALPADVAVGAHQVTATYVPGEASSYLGSTSESTDLTVTAADTSVALSLSASSATYPKSVTARVAVTADGTPAGTIQVRSGSTVIASKAAAAGTVSITLPVLKPGSYGLTAVFVPAAGSDLSGAVSPVAKLAVAKAKSSTGAKLTKGTIKANQNAKIKVSLKASGVTPTGTVTIKAGSKTLKKVTFSTKHKGVRTVTLPKQKAGTYKITVTYGGSALVAPSKSVTRTLKVTKK